MTTSWRSKQARKSRPVSNRSALSDRDIMLIVREPLEHRDDGTLALFEEGII